MNTANTVSAAEYCRAISALPMPIAAEIMAAEYAARCTELTLDEWIIWRDALLRVGENAGAVEIIPPLVREYFDIMTYAELARIVPPHMRNIYNFEEFRVSPETITYHPNAKYCTENAKFGVIFNTMQRDTYKIPHSQRFQRVELAMSDAMNHSFIVIRKQIMGQYAEYVMRGVMRRSLFIEAHLMPLHFSFIEDGVHMLANYYTGEIAPYISLEERRDLWFANTAYLGPYD